MSTLHIIRRCQFDFRRADLMKYFQPRAPFLSDQCENRAGDFVVIVYPRASKYRLSGYNYASSSIMALNNCANRGMSAETGDRYGLVSPWRGLWRL